jgi:hypothetical protein
MAVTVIFHELAGSGRQSHTTASGNTDQRLFLIRSIDRNTFATEMAGTPHPVFPNTYCSSIRISPFDPEQTPEFVISDPHTEVVVYAQNNGLNTLAICDYETDFSQARWPCDVPQPDFESGTALTMRMRMTGQFLRVSGRDLAWADNVVNDPGGPLVSDDSPAARILIPMSEFRLDWLFVDEPPIDEWEADLVGRVNLVTFLGSEPETILFEGFDLDPSRQFVVLDPFSFTISATFRKRRIVPAVGLSSSGTPSGTVYGWNHEYRHDGWERVKMFDGAGNPVDRYEQADFTDMFFEAPCGSSSA